MAKRSFSERMLRAKLTVLLSELEPKLAAAFYESIDDIRSNASLRHIVEALERHDYEEAIRALYIEDGAFNPLDRAISDAFNDGGNFAASTISGPGGGRVVFRFNVRSPRAERWLSAHSSGLITGITNDMRTAARQHLVAGMEAGLNPRATALSLVGRIDRATGRRVGGVLGLTSSQERFVSNARAELMSGDPALLRNYLTRERRDRRFDRHVMAAIREGRALESATIERMLGRYSDRLLELRGETVARTESMTALNQSHREAYEQAIDTGAIQRANVKRRWHATHDGRTRDNHSTMDGQTVPFDQPFTSPSGAQMMYPGDTSLGAGPAETIACRCLATYAVDHLADLR